MSKSKVQAIPGLTLGSILLASAPSAFAGGTIKVGENKSISIGMGIRTTFKAVEDAAPSGSAYSKDFAIEEARVYMSGQLDKHYKFTFNTKEIGGSVAVLDAIIQFEPSKAFNVWMGRMLTPADRIEMNGPFYALNWNQYTVPLFPSDQGGAAGLRGRDDGLTVWGTLGKFQYAVGVFDGYSGAGNVDDKLLFAGRFAYNILNMEDNPAYYTSSTYYGGLGDIFTIGVSGQQQSDGEDIAGTAGDFTAVAVDVLIEKVLGGGNVVTVEGEYKLMDADLSAPAGQTDAQKAATFDLFDGSSYFATAAFLIGGNVGPGKFQPYVRFNKNNPTSGAASDLTEVGTNYVISGHNLRFNLNITSGDAGITGAAGTDRKTVSFGMQQQF
ncbi:MAG TPA: hypothetical protein ENK06_06250 [Gammaproteobacteria bacterium]|nr:hypothetical protein [Gammaproteobacteria bacterium]